MGVKEPPLKRRPAAEYTKAMKEAEYRRKKRREFLRKAALVLFAATVIAAIGACNFYHPFRTLLPAYAVGERQEGEMRVHFLDIGQGDCTLVEFPDGSILVVDAGDGTWQNNSHLMQYLKGLQAESLTLIMTHADADHAGGFSSLFGAFDIRTLYTPLLPAATGIYRDTLALAEEQGCPIDTLVRYDVLTGGDAAAVCISPHAIDETDGNDSSTVLYLSYAGVNFLLGADISSEREEELLREYLLFEEIGEPLFDSGEHRVRLDETDILKISHHGSGNSSCEAWLDLLSPSTAVISCGRGNYYGHPAEETVARLAAIGTDIYRTDELGDIMITVSPDGTYRTEYGYLH